MSPSSPDLNGVPSDAFIPVAPAFGTSPVLAPSAAAAVGLEVRHEVQQMDLNEPP
jgi:hypothetical protein